MAKIQDIINEEQKQNKAIETAIKLTGLQSHLAAMENINPQLKFSGLGGVLDIARTISQQIKPLSAASLVLGNQIQKHLSAFEHPQINVLSGLANRLAEIAKTNPLASDRLSGFAGSQLILSNHLTSIANSLSNTHLKTFNSIDIALQGISKTYLKNIALSRNWEEIYVAEEANETISNIATDLLNNTTQVTGQDLENLKQSIVSGLSTLLEKTKTQKARGYIIDIITVISFLLTFYNPLTRGEKSNADVIIEIKKENEKIAKQYLTKIEGELKKLNKTRTARTNVNLRYSENEKSKVIGIVKGGQQVIVIEIRHKHLLITYIDKLTGEPKSGYVSKKYFDYDK